MKNLKNIFIPFVFTTVFFMFFLFLQVKSAGRELAGLVKFVLCSANLSIMFFIFLYTAKELKTKVLENENFLIQIRILAFLAISVFVAVISYLGQSAAAAKGLQPYKGPNLLFKAFPTIIVTFLLIVSLAGVLYWLEARSLKIIVKLKWPFLCIVPQKHLNDEFEEENLDSDSKQETPKVIDDKLMYFQKGLVKRLPLSEIVHITTDRPVNARGGKARNLTYIETSNGECLTNRYTLKQFESVLKEYKFFKVHRSHVLNRNFVLSSNDDPSYRTLKVSIGGKIREIPTSNKKWSEIKDWLME